MLKDLVQTVIANLKGQIPPGTTIHGYIEHDSKRVIIELILGIKKYSRSYSFVCLDAVPPKIFTDDVAAWVKSCLKLSQGEQAAPPPPKKIASSKEIVQALNSGISFHQLMELLDISMTNVQKKQQEILDKFDYKTLMLGYDLKTATAKLTMAQKPITATDILKQEEEYKKYQEEKKIYPGKFFDDAFLPSYQKNVPITDVRIMQAVLVILLMTPHDMLPGDDEPLIVTKELVDNVLANLNVRITRDGQSYTIQII